MTLLENAAPAPAHSATRVTRALLTCAAVGAPLWAVVALTQAATREGFDLTQHPLSALSNGALGWLQITNFLVGGLLTVIGAFGLRRALRGTPGGTWVPRLVGVNGLGMMAAGVLVMDPMPGFPVGSPAATGMSSAMIGHMLAGTIAFAAIAGACYVLGHHFGRTGHRGLAVLSCLAGTSVVLGDGWASAGGAMGSLTIAAGVLPGMLWVSLVAARLRRTA